MVSLFESLLSQPIPTIRSINCGRRLQCNVQDSAFDGKIEPCVFFFNKVQGDLKEVNGPSKTCSGAQTSGKPFCCKYATMLCPMRLDGLIM